MNQIDIVNGFLGLSFEGDEKEAVQLLAALEIEGTLRGVCGGEVV